MPELIAEDVDDSDRRDGNQGDDDDVLNGRGREIRYFG
jgi:hypothetical protein